MEKKKELVLHLIANCRQDWQGKNERRHKLPILRMKDETSLQTLQTPNRWRNTMNNSLYIFDNLDEVKSESCSVVSNSLQLYSPWNSPGQNTGVGSLSFSRGSSQPRDWTQVSCIAGRFFTSWATGKPKNTGVGSLSLLQWIFPTQESNWGLLHGRWILFFFF